MNEENDPMNTWANDAIRELRNAKLLTRKDRTPIRSDLDVGLVLGDSRTRVLVLRRTKTEPKESREAEDRLSQQGYANFAFSNGKYSLLFVSRSEERIDAICAHMLDSIPQMEPRAIDSRAALVS